MQPATLIKQARRAARLTQADLARRAGMKQPEIARLESTGANPRVSTLRRVVAATGHNLALGLDGIPEVDETMIVENLRYPAGDRLSQFEAAYRNIADLVSRTR
jgi:predicted transcriptional regulator